ncbi:hypothetical protein C5167_044274 [Papaver somniferum]|uniref:Uncharacterized protein n=1 Tax=Papaver somniferum TaxID=3469 RepID=A0A4Y7LAM7_PAPSO|nr:hypothetical protein C5167_044274 [Papaver somniferum]
MIKIQTSAQWFSTNICVSARSQKNRQPGLKEPPSVNKHPFFSSLFLFLLPPEILVHKRIHRDHQDHSYKIMTTIRNLCCNDLLDITHMLIDIPESMSPLSHYMVNMAEFSNNCLVAVAPGNQIKGYITALNEGKGKEKRCEISEMNYCYPTEDIGHTAEILVKTLDEAADKMHHVNYLEIDMPSDSCYLKMFKNLSASLNHNFDQFLHALDALRKNLSGGGLHLLAEAAAI